MGNKESILKELIDAGFPDEEVVLTLDIFFIGNSNLETIGVNIFPDQPPPSKFYDVLKQMLSAKKVDHVYIRVADADDPEEWFFSDTIYVIGNLSAVELSSILEELHPSEIYEGWMYGVPVNIPNDIDGKMVHSVWWD